MTPAETFLAHLQIASPCDAAWDAMAGDDRKRLCAQCDKHVYNVAQLTTAEVMALFGGEGPLPCLRLWRRADGTVLTADCPVGARRARGRRRTRFAAALILGLLATAPGVLAAQGPTGGAPMPVPRTLMGKVAPPPPKAAHPRPRRPKRRPLPPTVGIVASTSPLLGGPMPLPTPQAPRD
ncbi:MAG TPA: hypothetical protein VJ623_10100 [Holophagaceae bacterium]|nr:hypothetical protein [Holophagaceae bacterium]